MASVKLILPTALAVWAILALVANRHGWQTVLGRMFRALSERPPDERETPTEF